MYIAEREFMRAVYERNDRFEGHENGRIRRLIAHTMRRRQASIQLKFMKYFADMINYRLNGIDR